MLIQRKSINNNNNNKSLSKSKEIKINMNNTWLIIWLKPLNMRLQKIHIKLTNHHHSNILKTHQKMFKWDHPIITTPIIMTNNKNHHKRDKKCPKNNSASNHNKPHNNHKNNYHHSTSRNIHFPNVHHQNNN